ncbi:AcrR family transcriptional regulator [Streptosporangium becharense]|uniref:AcrR family transcriptional regulator n=1 Tax=Streptosporangium becharense TaxID=1816182 RepID=A0A7W9IB34_9ACTN|nr:helix-turn-helix domain-containing protein [Streptosporangium becharense]MBB2915336.1 AcrR family transcriptional regulator [Streptosporangium becharense]MBB5816966.1 AcrR family transcriptional regulator [Streptosporangium becharense]
MSNTASPQSGVRGRTRRAILSAAASVFARDRSATLADVAGAADVGRSTLHRYFPDRDELIRAVIDDSLEMLGQAVTDAAIDRGPAEEGMRRLVAAMLGVGDRLRFLFGDMRMLQEHHPAPAPEDPDCPQDSVPDPVIVLIRRGQSEGVFDPEVSAGWIQQVLWGLVYTAAEEVDKGNLPRHVATATVIRTLENGVHTRRSPSVEPRVGVGS